MREEHEITIVDVLCPMRKTVVLCFSNGRQLFTGRKQAVALFGETAWEEMTKTPAHPKIKLQGPPAARKIRDLSDGR